MTNLIRETGRNGGKKEKEKEIDRGKRVQGEMGKREKRKALEKGENK